MKDKHLKLNWKEIFWRKGKMRNKIEGNFVKNIFINTEFCSKLIHFTLIENFSFNGT